MVAGLVATRLSKALDSVDKLTVFLIFCRITLWMNITVKERSKTGLCLVNKALEVFFIWVGAILGQGKDSMAAVIAGLLYNVPTIIVRVVALA